VVAVHVRDEDRTQSCSDQGVRRMRCWVPSPQSTSDQWRAAREAPKERRASALTLRALLGVPDPVPRNWNSMPCSPGVGIVAIIGHTAAAAGTFHSPRSRFHSHEKGFHHFPLARAGRCVHNPAQISKKEMR
jgi:hypothetical protein